MPKEIDSSITPSDVYVSAVSMLNHYSTMRTCVLSFMTPVILGIAGFALNLINTNHLLVYLFFGQFFLCICLIYTSKYFGMRINETRRFLIRLEKNTAGNETLFSLLSNVGRPVKLYRIPNRNATDGFDLIVWWSSVIWQVLIILGVLFMKFGLKLFSI